MSVAVAILFFCLALALSIVSSLVLARDIDKIGKRLELPEPLIGLLTAFGADAPEISMAIVALRSGRHDIGAGIVFGSNLFNLAALLGLSAVVAGKVRIRRPGLLLNGTVALLISGVALGLVTGLFPSWAALVLVLAFFIPYVAISVVRPRQLSRILPPGPVQEFLAAAVTSAGKDARPATEPPKARGQDTLSAIPALACVGLTSVALVHTASDLGQHFGISDTVIGVLVLATLSGAPNVVAALRLARRHRGSAVISESLNSNTLNIVVGLVIPALVAGIGHPSALTQIGAAWVIGLTALTLLLTARRGGLVRREGIVVMLGYAAYVALVLAR